MLRRKGGCTKPEDIDAIPHAHRRDGLLAKAETATGKKRTKALKKARAQLAKIDKKTTKAAAKGKIADSCKTAILGASSRIRGAVADVQ